MPAGRDHNPSMSADVSARIRSHDDPSVPTIIPGRVRMFEDSVLCDAGFYSFWIPKEVFLRYEITAPRTARTSQPYAPPRIARLPDR